MVQLAHLPERLDQPADLVVGVLGEAREGLHLPLEQPLLVFYEWYGIPNLSDEAMWAQQPDFDPAVAHLEYVMEGRRGEKPSTLLDEKAR
ncbi:MAG: hypothetical protein ACREX9_04860 [Gammaproteobacteria bacterium]